MKRRWLSFLLTLALLCACLPQQTYALPGTDIEFAPADGVEIGKTYVIVADGKYALTDRQEGPALHSYEDGAQTTLASAPVSADDGVLTGEITADMLWTVGESTAPAAYDGMEQYFLRDQLGNYLRRGTGSGGQGAQMLCEPGLNEKSRYYTWSFYPYGDGTFAVYVNSDRAYGRDCPYYLYGNETSFDSPSRRQRTAADPFAFTQYDDCSRIRLFEAVGYEPCTHEYVPSVTAPTCTEKGYTTYTCTLCGMSYRSDYTDELFHDWPDRGTVTKEPTETERGVLTLTCTRCGASRERPLAAGTEKAHKNEILFISDLHSGKNAENGYHNLRAMFRLLRENDDFVPEVVSGGGDYVETRVYDDADWPRCFEALQDIMYEGSPDTVQVLAAGNHEWEWSRMSDEVIELLLGSPRTGLKYSSDDFEIFQIGAHTNDSPKEEFLDGDIEQLRTYLGSMAGSGKVVFIHTHWPLHYGYNSDSWRTTKNADEMIDLLNEYSETLDICFIWGHNHNEDEMRHRCLVRGDDMEYADGKTKQIRFTYINAGCLNEKHAKEGAGPEDSQYGPGYLLEARIEGDRLILDYGHITGAWPDPSEAQYDHNADLLYVEEIQEARPSHHEIPLLHRGGCEHEYTRTVTEPTCTESGFTTYTCTKCGDSYTADETAALGHDYEADRTEPTCTEGGFTTHVCTRCADTYTDGQTGPLGHDYQGTATAPTCTENGFTTYTCARCGDTYTGGETDALGHDWDGGRITREPTETEPGERTFSCSRCGATKTEPVPATEHDYTAAVTAPTCTEKGFTTYTCTHCGDSYTADWTEALGHDYAAAVTAPTCTEKGFTTYTCTRCGDSYTADRTEALGHDYADGVCIRCGAKEDGSGPEIDVSALEEAILAAGAVDKDHYTEESVEALERVLAAAGTVLESPGTQAEVDEAVRAVREAVASLIPLQDDPFLFDDVADDTRFYFDPVYWAYYAEPQITNGMDATHFGPDSACTRGHVVTFLWRAAGCPEPVNTGTPFRDLKSGAFYERAVAWAVENGITNGMTAASFAPDAVCTRGQIVTFLWRANGSPGPAGPDNPFTDVPADRFYTAAVLWAAGEKITMGTSGTEFSPEATCTRGHVVTFLYRARTDDSR